MTAEALGEELPPGGEIEAPQDQIERIQAFPVFQRERGFRLDVLIVGAALVSGPRRHLRQRRHRERQMWAEGLPGKDLQEAGRMLPPLPFAVGV